MSVEDAGVKLPLVKSTSFATLSVSLPVAMIVPALVTAPPMVRFLPLRFSVAVGRTMRLPL